MDQVNIPLCRTLSGRGGVNIDLSAAGHIHHPRGWLSPNCFTTARTAREGRCANGSISLACHGVVIRCQLRFKADRATVDIAHGREQKGQEAGGYRRFRKGSSTDEALRCRSNCRGQIPRLRRADNRSAEDPAWRCLASIRLDIQRGGSFLSEEAERLVERTCLDVIRACSEPELKLLWFGSDALWERKGDDPSSRADWEEGVLKDLHERVKYAAGDADPDGDRNRKEGMNTGRPFASTTTTWSSCPRFPEPRAPDGAARPHPGTSQDYQTRRGRTEEVTGVDTGDQRPNRSCPPDGR